MRTRRLVGALGVGLVVLGSASLASADPPGCPKDHGNGNGNPYPPGQCRLAENTSQTQPGGKVTLHGVGYAPGEDVQVDLHSTPVRLGDVNADSTGSFTLTVTVPRDTPLGQHTFSGYGVVSTQYLTTPITVVAADSFGSSTSGGSVTTVEGRQLWSGGGLPHTGAEIAAMTAGGLLVIGAGTALLVTVRRRRTARAAA